LKIRQINVTYIPLEDRILLRINTDDNAELRFWLTRAVVIQLLSGLTKTECLMAGPKIVNNPQVAQAIRLFEQETAAAKVDFTANFSANAVLYPLGEVPQLVTTLRIMNATDHAATIFELANNQTITINFDPQMLGSFYKLLCDIVKISSWNLPQQQLSVAAFPRFWLAESQTIH